jgi:hypothetical protein
MGREAKSAAGGKPSIQRSRRAVQREDANESLRCPGAAWSGYHDDPKDEWLARYPEEPSQWFAKEDVSQLSVFATTAKVVTQCEKED